MNVSTAVPVALIGWLPITFLLFCTMTPRRAVLASFIGGFLFLPSVSYKIVGVPDFGKDIVVSVGSLACVAVFDARRLFAVRPRWYDLPVVGYCASMVLTHLAEGLPLYEGFSESLTAVILYGIPYLLGRAYFGDLDGQRDLAMGVVLGGLAYVPLCLFEVRMSPQLNQNIYGYSNITSSGFVIDVMRWGGYRPLVFLGTGLILGIWMAAAALTAFCLWRGRAVRQLHGVGFGSLTVLLVVTAVLCKSTGAIILLGGGLVLAAALMRSKSPALYLVFLLAPLLYMSSRATGAWSGLQMVDFTKTYVNADRAASLKFRIDNENILLEKALRKPVFGWGGWRGRVYDKDGKDVSIIDGLWIVVIGNVGLFGLASFTLIYYLPPLLFLKRYPVPLWREPAVAPALASSLVVGIYLIDNLFNGTMAPAVTMTCGGLMGLSVASPPRGGRAGAAPAGAVGVSEVAVRLVDSGRVAEAEGVCREAVGRYKVNAAVFPNDPRARRDLAAARNSLGAVLLAAGRHHEAGEALAEALALQEKLVEASPADPVYRQELACTIHNLGNVYAADGQAREAERLWRVALGVEGEVAAAYPGEPSYQRELAAGLDQLGRVLAAQGRDREADEVRLAAVEWWSGLSAAHPDEPEYRDRWADGCNDLAWSLAGAGGPEAVDAESAVKLAVDATRLKPDCATYWNTLGVAYYRAGVYESASGCLEQAAVLNRGGTGFDLYALALAYHRQGRDEQAQWCYLQGERWASAHAPLPPDLVRVRGEASALLDPLAAVAPQASGSNALAVADAAPRPPADTGP